MRTKLLIAAAVAGLLGTANAASAQVVFSTYTNPGVYPYGGVVRAGYSPFVYPGAGIYNAGGFASPYAYGGGYRSYYGYNSFATPYYGGYRSNYGGYRAFNYPGYGGYYGNAYNRGGVYIGGRRGGVFIR